MTDNVKIFKDAMKTTRFGHAKNAVPFAVGNMLKARGIDCTMTRYGCGSENEM